MLVHNLFTKNYLLERRVHLNYDVPKMERWRVTVYLGKIHYVPKMERWRVTYSCKMKSVPKLERWCLALYL